VKKSVFVALLGVLLVFASFALLIDKQDKEAVVAPPYNEPQPAAPATDGYGGEGETYFFRPLEHTFYGAATFFADIVGEEKYLAWVKQFFHDTPNRRNPAELTMLNLVKELGVPKEAFLAFEASLSHDVPRVTVEQIEALYSGDQKRINRQFVNRFALLVDDVIYTLDWLASRCVNAYERAGIKPHHITEYLARIDATGMFESEYLSILSNYVKMAPRRPGERSRHELNAPYSLSYYGIDGFFEQLVGKARLTEWMDQFLFDHVNNKRGRPLSERNVATLVRELAISRAALEGADVKGTYSREEIEAIFSGDQAAISRAFANKHAR